MLNKINQLTDNAIQNMPQNSPFLRMNNLIVGHFQSPEYLYILYIHCGNDLKGCLTILMVTIDLC